MATLGSGFKVGHWTNKQGDSGCTVVLPPSGNVSSCDIRGSSPSSREVEHLHPDRRLTEIHAILLTGGSAFGLAAADGVVTWLEEKGIGYATPIGPIPIVPGAVVFDVGTANPASRPVAASGRAACEDAREEEIRTGRVGAGTGATVGKWAGREFASPGGVGMATVTDSGASVSAMAVVNAIGDVLAPDGTVLAGTTAESPEFVMPVRRDREGNFLEADTFPSNTVLAVVVTSASLDKRDVRWLASRGSDGIATSVRPAHTRYDGDVVFAVAAPGPEASIDLLGYLATQAVAGAIRNAVTA
jgi:L-aminopeptidase/D-esterase-like protein